MWWLQTGFILGQVFFFLLIIGITFSRDLRSKLFEKLFSNTIFGVVGTYLFLSDNVDEDDLKEVGPFTLYVGGGLIFVFLVALLWFATSVIFLFLGALLLPAFAGVLLLSPLLIYMYNKNKSKFRDNES